MKRTLVFMILFAVVFSLAGTFPLIADVREVIATGTAAGVGEKAKDEALARALRDAVEKAVGVYVEADTMVKNYQLLEDKIYSRVKGYVKSYEIISDNKGEGGITEIKIKAVVSADLLKDDLTGLDIIKSSKGNPRVVILINEYIDGNESPVDNVRSTLEKDFLAKNFKLVDKTQLTAIKTRDVSVSFEDPQKAATLGARLGAEVVITGSANAEFMEKSKPYGVSVYAYSAEANLKAVRTDTAEVIAVVSANSVKRAGGRNLTANEALQDCGKQLSEKIIVDIAEKWRSEIYNTVDMLLFISNADSQTRLSLLQSLKETRGIKEVNEKTYTNNLMEIDLEIEGAAAKVIDKKIMEKMPYLQLKNKTPNRLDFHVTGSPSLSSTEKKTKIIKAVETKVMEQETAKEEVEETDIQEEESL